MVEWLGDGVEWSGVSRRGEMVFRPGVKRCFEQGDLRGSGGLRGRIRAGLPHARKPEIKFDRVDDEVKVWLPW